MSGRPGASAASVGTTRPPRAAAIAAPATPAAAIGQMASAPRIFIVVPKGVAHAATMAPTASATPIAAASMFTDSSCAPPPRRRNAASAPSVAPASA
ncbi:MAG: hypothetical protein U0P30_13130 [Vicinamibacterales bacterium]